MVAKVLVKAGLTVQAQETMCKAVVKTVLIYGTDSWLVMRAMLKVLERFNH